MNLPRLAGTTLTGTNCHGPKPVHTTEVLLYMHVITIIALKMYRSPGSSTSFSTVFQSYQGDLRLIMKDSVQ